MEDRIEQQQTDALNRIGRALELLGNADAATPMGGLEAHGLAVKEGSDNIADALREVAAGLEEIAAAIRAGQGTPI